MPLRVTQAFADYQIGDEISDASAVEAVMGSNLAHFVVAFDDPAPAEAAPSAEPTPAQGA